MKTILFEKFSQTQIIPDKKISIALMSSFIVLSLQYLILISFDLMNTEIGSSIQLISKVAVGLAYLYAFPIVIKRSLKKFLFVNIIAFLIFLTHYIVFHENRSYLISLVFPVFFMSLPTLIYAMSINDLMIFKQVTLKSSDIVFTIGFFIGLMVLLDIVSIGTYSIALSYYMLLPAILYIDELFVSFSIKRLMIVIVSLFIIISFGSRGAILCIVVFVLLRVLRMSIRLTGKNIIGITAITFLTLITLVNFEKYLNSLFSLLTQYGINSRTLRLFLSGSINLSGRDSLYNNVLFEILENPILGVGIAGDTRIIGNSYVHNFYIEVIGNFGLLLGPALVVTLTFFIIKTLLTKNMVNYNLTIIWLSLGFVHLQVSSSYLIDIKFWIFLGLLYNMRYLQNKNVEKPLII